MSQEDVDIEAVIKKAFEEPAAGAVPLYEVDTADIDLTDGTAEANLEKQDAERDGVVVPDLPTDTGEDDFESTFDADPVAEAAAVISSAFTKDYDFASVEVTPEERDRFYRCGLHDEEMWYDVSIEGSGITVRVAIPPASYSEVVLAVLDSWTNDKFIGSNAVQYLHAFQQLSAWLMVRSVNGVPTDWYEQAVEDAGGKMTYRKMRELLVDPDSIECVRSINEVRWASLALAIRIADYKHHLCLQALRTKKVFTTAGSV
jgi:hypothetical protein